MNDINQGILKASNGRYKTIRLIGKGGMGIVFEAEDTYLSRTVAIKQILPQYADDQEFVGFFFREAKLQAQLKHPNIVKVLDFNPQGDAIYFVMELIEGVSLARIMKENKLPFRIICCIISQIAEALSYAHHGPLKMFHRDLKPANILINSQGSCLITDFGLSKALSSTKFTKSGEVHGTPSYMSPEQIDSNLTQDHRIDCYALGVITYELVTGKPPFTSDSYMALMYKHVHENPKPLSFHDSSVPAWFESMTLKCLEKAPENRFNDLKEITNIIDYMFPLKKDFNRELGELVLKSMNKEDKKTLPPKSPSFGKSVQVSENQHTVKEDIQEEIITRMDPRPIIDSINETREVYLGKRNNWLLPAIIVVLVVVSAYLLIIWKPWQTSSVNLDYFVMNLKIPNIPMLEQKETKKTENESANEAKKDEKKKDETIKKTIEKTAQKHEVPVAAKHVYVPEEKKSQKEFAYKVCPKCGKKYFRQDEKFCNQCPGQQLITVYK
ncbi:MAG: serine/threonine protein kinase [Candidatus Coatesbacteria bacterium]|nr:serine/threonine protein kinase [Candidatus Coatesbacteria bacterium]